uniref:Putative secreted protein n=1 Tax=Anopheles darlingi TaxID=43151 RepID=A0A2M4D4X4_ANODA
MWYCCCWLTLSAIRRGAASTSQTIVRSSESTEIEVQVGGENPHEKMRALLLLVLLVLSWRIIGTSSAQANKWGESPVASFCAPLQGTVPALRYESLSLQPPSCPSSLPSTALMTHFH